MVLSEVIKMSPNFLCIFKDGMSLFYVIFKPTCKEFMEKLWCNLLNIVKKLQKENLRHLGK